MTAEPPAGRAVSPVVGVALLVAIVTVLAAAAGYAIFALSEETDPAPNVVMELDPTDDGVTYELQHVSGDDIAGERTRLAGVADERALHGERLTAGEKVEVVPTDSDVELYWHGNDTSYTLQTFDVGSDSLAFDAGGIDAGCGWVEGNINANGDLDMSNESAVCSVTEETDTGLTDINVDLDDGSVLVGAIDTDGDVDIDSSVVAGGVTTTGNDITVTDGSTVYGDVVASPGTNADIDGDSAVSGAVVVDGGSLSLADADIDGHVYADPGDVSCSGSTLGPNDRNCSSYGYRDPGEY